MPYALGYGHIIVLGFPFVIIGTVINVKNIKLSKSSFIIDSHVIKKICALGFASCLII